MLKNFAELNKESDHSAKILTALEGISNVFSADFDKKTGTATVVMSDSNKLRKQHVNTAFRKAKLPFEIESLGLKKKKEAEATAK